MLHNNQYKFQSVRTIPKSLVHPEVRAVQFTVIGNVNQNEINLLIRMKA